MVPRMRFAALLLVPFLLLTGAPPTSAQETLAPYQRQLISLSQILGTVHHIRSLCRRGEETVWRDAMMDLIRLEDPSQETRERMVRSFNEAYHEARARYPSCSSAAEAEARRLAGEGERLVATMAAQLD
jgi:uncharacterized protein (TIGR02301 family)